MKIKIIGSAQYADPDFFSELSSSEKADLVGCPDGVFHADEALALATLAQSQSWIRLIRSQDREVLAWCDKLAGFPHASAGSMWQSRGQAAVFLVLRDQGIRLTPAQLDKVWEAVESRLIQATQGEGNFLSQACQGWNSLVPQGQEELREQFLLKAIEMAEAILVAEIISAAREILAKE